MTGQEILDLPMEVNDAGADTIREYLKKLLFLVWEEDEGFDGKRPFGNSGWCNELYLALVVNGAVKGTVSRTVDEIDDWECYDRRKAFSLIHEAIGALN